MNRSESIKTLVPALLKAQKAMTNAVKGSNNPFFKSTYADLNAVREVVIPPLQENGFVVLQPTVEVNCKNFVETVFMHESGEWISSLTEIKNTKGDAQGEGSAISYARRYGLQSLPCIGAVDDDGEKAMNRSDTSTTASKTTTLTQVTTEAKKGPGRPAKTPTTTNTPALAKTVNKPEVVVNEDEW